MCLLLIYILVIRFFVSISLFGKSEEVKDFVNILCIVIKWQGAKKKVLAFVCVRFSSNGRIMCMVGVYGGKEMYEITKVRHIKWQYI